jgi:hypothetical protein
MSAEVTKWTWWTWWTSVDTKSTTLHSVHQVHSVHKPIRAVTDAGQPVDRTYNVASIEKVIYVRRK